MLENHNLILLVDDDESVNYLNKRMLLNFDSEITLVALFNGAEAIRKIITLNESFCENDSVLVLLDLNMPILDGWGFLDEFKKIQYALKYTVNIFILSSSFNPLDIEKAKQNSLVIDYICKPLTIDKLNSIEEFCKRN